MSEIIEWKNPPVNSAGRPGTDWHAVATELRTRPGQWALIRKAETRPNIKQPLEKLGSWFEVVTRKGDSGFEAYARWNCPADNGSAAEAFWSEPKS